MRTIASGTHAHAPTIPTSYTPGPWRRCSHRQIATTAGAGLPICEVWSGGIGIEQADANECLIAAAPDLYEVAAALLEIASAKPPAPLHPLFLRARDAFLPAELVTAAMAAVAKVNGGAA